MNMSTEPIRLPALIIATVIVVLAIIIAVVLGLELDEALILVLGAFTASGALVANAETKRAFTDSPATVERRLSDLAGYRLPEDERSGCSDLEA
jgi:uncharacterized transporter YbjL